MTQKLTFKIGTVSLTALTLAGCAYLGLGTPDPRWADYSSWTRINDEPITGDHTSILGNLHQGSDGFRDIYVNDVGRDTMLDPNGPYNYPVGTVIVKEQYSGQKAYERGADGHAQGGRFKPDSSVGLAMVTRLHHDSQRR